jgi:hypothetical protein
MLTKGMVQKQKRWVENATNRTVMILNTITDVFRSVERVLENPKNLFRIKKEVSVLRGHTLLSW